MNTFYLNIDPTRKNFLVVDEPKDGRVRITQDCKTDDELADILDYWEYNDISGLEIGQSVLMDGGAYVIRIY